jgi:hypothetical protein
MVASTSARRREKDWPLLMNEFAQMIPQIQHHTRFAFRGVRPPDREALLVEVVGNAFLVFTRLAEHGLEHLAYPRPLAMAALALTRRTHGPFGGVNV